MIRRLARRFRRWLSLQYHLLIGLSEYVNGSWRIDYRWRRLPDPIFKEYIYTWETTIQHRKGYSSRNTFFIRSTLKEKHETLTRVKGLASNRLASIREIIPRKCGGCIHCTYHEASLKRICSVIPEVDPRSDMSKCGLFIYHG